MILVLIYVLPCYDVFRIFRNALCSVHLADIPYVMVKANVQDMLKENSTNFRFLKKMYIMLLDELDQP